MPHALDLLKPACAFGIAGVILAAVLCSCGAPELRVSVNEDGQGGFAIVRCGGSAVLLSSSATLAAKEIEP